MSERLSYERTCCDCGRTDTSGFARASKEPLTWRCATGVGCQRKRCAYCLASFTGRGRCCCPEHARKVNGKTAWVSRSRKIAQSQTMARLQKAVRFVPNWRKAAMGDDSQVALIFGTEPDPAPHRHGEYLDAS